MRYSQQASVEPTGGMVTDDKATDILSADSVGWARRLLVTRGDDRDYNWLCHLNGGTWYEDSRERGLTNPSKGGII